VPVDTRLRGYDSCQFIWIQLPLVGESVQALETLRKALDVGQSQGKEAEILGWAVADPDFARIRDDVRFKDLVRAGAT